jgi:hypothetical protein
MTDKSRNALDGEIIIIRRGLAIYKVVNSPFYKARMRNPKTGKYTVRSTKETARIEARRLAEELYESFLSGGSAKAAPTQYSFETYTKRFLEEARDLTDRGIRNPSYFRDAKLAVENRNYGLNRHFGNYDVREITTTHFNDYLRDLLKRNQAASKSLIAVVTATFRNIMKVAASDGLIPAVPATPKPKTAEPKPRPFFRFQPLVDKRNDQYHKILATIRRLAKEEVKVRGIPLNMEFYDLVVFLTNSFVRPTYSELYDLQHQDIAAANGGNAKTLTINIRRGKTGERISATMEASVNIYEQICQRYPNHEPTDYIFYPETKNRTTAIRNAQRLLNYTLEQADLMTDPYTNQKHTMYSFRHTAICMRLVNSKGKVNIYTLAKNAGTSVEMIEKNYARKLPIAGELVENLQSFGD